MFEQLQLEASSILLYIYICNCTFLKYRMYNVHSTNIQTYNVYGLPTIVGCPS
jgi:hypothetical protein